MTTAALDYAASHRKDNLNHLIEFLRIPSVSTDPRRRNDIRHAAEWLVARLREIGMTRAETIPTVRHPIVYGEWLGAGEQAPTLLVYGHYDVQPTDPDDEWNSPPFEPTVRAEHLYARGVSDDKGQLYTHLAAAEAFFRAGGQPPVNLKFLIEGEEEIGSPNLGAFVQQHDALLACDVAVISDTEMLNPQTPAIVYSVRGLAYVEVEVRGPKADLHSGAYGGVAHNPLQVAVEMLAALHDEKGRVAIPGFYDKVRSLTKQEQAELTRLPFDEGKFLRDEVGAPALWTGEAGYSVLERIGARPTLELHGIRGGFTGEGQKTVIPGRVVAKVSMRLVADQDAFEIARLFERRIRELAPPTVTVEVRTLSLGNPAIIPQDSPAMQAAVRAYRSGFGAEPVFLRSGGSLPVVTILNKALGVPVVMMGFGLPDDNLHAPNERLRVENFYRGIETQIHFVNELGREAVLSTRRQEGK